MTRVYLCVKTVVVRVDDHPIRLQLCDTAGQVRLFVVALWNRADHYFFALWFLLSFFLSFFLSFILFSFFPRLISAVRDWMSAILPHMVWP